MKTQIRIVAGALRGRKLSVQVNPNLRPTPQMVREALFSILGNAVPDRPFYDIFSGTGVNGLEALSRGAVSVTFVERVFRLANDIDRHLEAFGVADAARVVRTDAYRWAERWIPQGSAPVNLFLSPPFPDLTDRADEFLGLVRTLLDKAPDESVLTIQAEDGFPVEQLPDLAAWDVRRYGRNMLLFYIVSRTPAPPPAAPAVE